MRAILVVSGFLIFIFLPRPWSIIIPFVLILIEQLLERIVFSTQITLLFPAPNRETWITANFNSLAFGAIEDASEPGIFGMVFENIEAGIEVFKAIRQWNNNLDSDLDEDNIIISIVVDEGKDTYGVFIYPRVARADVDSFRKAAALQAKFKGKVLKFTIEHLTIMRSFSNYEQSALKELFEPRYANGGRFYLAAFAGSPENTDPIIPIDGVAPVLKNSFSILRRNELTDADFEEFFCDFHLDWDTEDDTPPPRYSGLASPYR